MTEHAALTAQEELKSAFLQGMSMVAATVSVVSSDGVSGKAGVTVSAMSSVSADTEKPTLLVCLNETSDSAKNVLENGVFCVNVLADTQALVSDVFAGRYTDRFPERFECAEWKKEEISCYFFLGYISIGFAQI